MTVTGNMTVETRATLAVNGGTLNVAGAITNTGDVQPAGRHGQLQRGRPDGRRTNLAVQLHEPHVERERHQDASAGRPQHPRELLDLRHDDDRQREVHSPGQLHDRDRRRRSTRRPSRTASAATSPTAAPSAPVRRRSPSVAPRRPSVAVPRPPSTTSRSRGARRRWLATSRVAGTGAGTLNIGLVDGHHGRRHACVTSNTATLTHKTGYVIGKLQKAIPTGAQAPSFELGTATTYLPVVVTFGNVSTSGALTVSSTASAQPQLATSGLSLSHSVSRYWTLTPA